MTPDLRPDHVPRLEGIFSDRVELLCAALGADVRDASWRAGPQAAFASLPVFVPTAPLGQWVIDELAMAMGSSAGINAAPLNQLEARLLRALTETAEIQDFEGALFWYALERIESGIAYRGAPPALAAEAMQSPQRRVAVAARLARVFERYRLLRPHWLIDPESSPLPAWQRRFWRDAPALPGIRQALSLTARLDAATTGTRMALAQALPLGIAVFGLSSLSPSRYALLLALSRLIAVRVYALTPCAEWWADLRPPAPRVIPDASLSSAFDLDDDPHPLLASWGKAGREFQEIVFGEKYESTIWASAFVRVDAANNLDRLRESLAGNRPMALAGWEPDDALSIAVHAAPNALREVQILHDALVRRLTAWPELRARDVAVLFSDPAVYAPLVDAVFGLAERPRLIPWRGGNARTGTGDGFAELMDALLRLPGTRMTRSAVFDWLAWGPVRARFGLDNEQVERAEALLIRAGAKWGFDAGDRVGHGAALSPVGGLRFALDRLLLGFAGDDGERRGETPSIDGIDRRDALALGGISALLDALEAARRLWAESHAAEVWPRRALAALAALTAPNSDDIGWREAQAVFLERVGDATTRAAAGTAGARIDGELLRHVLLATAVQTSRSTQARGSDATIAALSEWRGVPFAIVAVLGLDAARFPDAGSADAWDETARHPLRSDIGPGDEARWQLLEVVMAARRSVILSYAEFDERGDAAGISPALKTFVDTCARYGFEGDAAAAERALVMRPPVRADDPRCYLPGAPWQSFDPIHLPRASAPMTVIARASRPAVRAIAMSSAPVEIRWSSVLAWLRNPARSWLDALRARRDEAAPVDDDDPQQLDALDAHSLRRTMLESDALDDVSADAIHALAVADGLLEQGFSGRRKFDDALAEVRGLIGAVDCTQRAEWVDVVVSRRRARVLARLPIAPGRSLLALTPSKPDYAKLRPYIADFMLARAADAADTLLVGSAAPNAVGWHRFDPPPGPDGTRDAANAWLDGVIDCYLARGERLHPLPRSAAAAAAMAWVRRVKQAPDGCEADAHLEAAFAEARSAWLKPGGGPSAHRAEREERAWRVLLRERDVTVDPAFRDLVRRIDLPLALVFLRRNAGDG